jgi:hypothetical protein
MTAYTFDYLSIVCQRWCFCLVYPGMGCLASEHMSSVPFTELSNEFDHFIVQYSVHACCGILNDTHRGKKQLLLLDWN